MVEICSGQKEKDGEKGADLHEAFTLDVKNSKALVLFLANI